MKYQDYFQMFSHHPKLMAPAVIITLKFKSNVLTTLLSDVSDGRRAEPIMGGPGAPPEIFLKVGFEMVLFRAIF